MGIEAQEPTHLQRLATPVVGQVSVLKWVLATQIKAATVITPGTTLQSFCAALSTPPDGAADGGFTSYLLSDEPPRVRDDGYLGYVFTKPSTAASTDLDQQTPVYERTLWWQDGMLWPNVLRWLKGVQGTSANESEAGLVGSSATSSTHTRIFAVDQFDLVPGGMFPTEVMVRKYLTPQPITGIVLERPHATPVRYNYLGMVNSLECLHGNVIVPPLLTSPVPIADFGTEEAPDLSRGQLFPRTNHLSWQPHFFGAEMQAEPKNGVYETTIYEALPPPMPQAQEL